MHREKAAKTVKNRPEPDAARPSTLCGLCALQTRVTFAVIVVFAALIAYLCGAVSLISRRRPRLTHSGGAGIVIWSTPSLKVALA